MARMGIAIPEGTPFQCRIPVRITDINYGGHLGNDSYLSILHDVRVRWLNALGYSELDIEGVGMVMNEALLQYKSEVFYPDTLLCSLFVDNVTRVGFDLVYVLESEQRGKRALIAKTGQVFYDYHKKKVARTPALFRERFA
ncbi:MAG: thioesterase [Calditrichaeota bacterium]|nr:MAG: thioesterase [Calditrichota bacterium]